MNIAGLAKLTLLDFPGHTACTVFTPGCSFRCPFCHNASLVLPGQFPDSIGEEEFFSFLSKRRGLLDGVCITGGEPLLQQDLPQFMRRIREMGFLVKLDTNGSFPEKLQEILSVGLADYVAMDIKNSPEKYAETAGVPGLDVSRIEKSIRLLMDGGVPFEFRTTVCSELHTVQSVGEAAKWISGAPRYFIQQYKDSENIIAPGLTPCDPETLEAMRAAAAQFVPSVQLRGI